MAKFKFLTDNKTIVCLQTNVYQYGLSVLFYKHSEIVSYFCFLSPHYFVRGRLKTKIFSQ